MEKVALVILARINRTFLALVSYFQEKSLPLGDIVNITQYLNPRLIMFTEEMRQHEVIRQLTDLAFEVGVVKDKEMFYQAVIDREKIVSTGIGMGIAIPHAKLGKEGQFFIAIGIHKQEGIEWKSLDNAPVRLVFLVGGPVDQHKTYLKILSHLTDLIKHSSLKEDLLKAVTAEQVMTLFEERDILNS